jgi:hypothetical protein
MAFLPGTVPDENAFTAGTSPFTPEGGVFNDAAAALTSGQQGTGRQTPNRARHVNLRDQAGTEIATASNPLRTDPTGTTKQPVLLYDASGNPITSTASALDVNIKSGAASFTVIDEAAWTAGTSPFVPEGGVFNDAAAALTSGQQGAGRQTPNRARHVNLRRQDGTEIGVAATPLIDNVAQLGGTAIDTNSGNKSAGTQRVVLATDQPTLSTPMPVSEATLDGCISAARVAISTTGDGAQTLNQYPNWRANRVALADIATGSTSTGTILTGAPGYFIDGFIVSIDPQSTRAGGSNLLLTLVDSSFGNVFQTSFFVPNAVTVPTFPTFAPQIPVNFRWNNKTANSTLSLTINATITANIHIVVNYGITSVVN